MDTLRPTHPLIAAVAKLFDQELAAAKDYLFAAFSGECPGAPPRPARSPLPGALQTRPPTPDEFVHHTGY